MFSAGEDVEATCFEEAGVVDLGDRPPSWPGPQDGPDYLEGDASRGCAGGRARTRWQRFVPYVTARFADDPHVWASALFDEVVEVGYDRSYPSFVRQLRAAGLRPHCEACAGVSGRETIEIDHPAGEEIQWDWFERRRAPWGAIGYVLLGTLPHSGRTRGVIAPTTDQAHLVEAMDAVLRRLGGTARRWRVDRMATVIVPGSADVQASFAPVAKHYGASVVAVPAPAGEPQGVGGSGGAFRDGAVVADPDRGVTRGRPGQPGPVLVDHRRRPSAQPGPYRRTARRWQPVPLAHGGRAGRRRAAHGVAGRSVPGHRRGHRSSRRPGQRGLPRQPLLGRSRPGRHEP